MPNYKKGIIYKLCCKDLDIIDIYVGSTCSFTRRKAQHKISSIDNNKPVYQFIRENGGFENWDMVEIEKYEAKDKFDLNKRERYFIELYKSSLNTRRPVMYKTEDRKGYNEEFKDEIRESRVENYENKREQYLQKMRENHERNKEERNAYKKQKYLCTCGSEVVISHKARHEKTNKHMSNV